MYDRREFCFLALDVYFREDGIFEILVDWIQEHEGLTLAAAEEIAQGFVDLRAADEKKGREHVEARVRLLAGFGVDATH